jgi:hypothetical protein
MRGVSGQDALGAFDENDASARWVDIAEIVAQRVVRNFGKRASQLDAGWSSAHDDEGQPGAELLGIAFALGSLEGEQNAATHVDRVLNCFQSGGEFLPLIVAEILMTRTGGHRQGVVFEGAITQNYASVLYVNVRGFRQPNGHVLLFSKYLAKGRGNIGRRERPGGHLVEQRLKKMVIHAVEQAYLDGRVLERARQAQPAKTTPDDDNFVLPSHLANSRPPRPAAHPGKVRGPRSLRL